MIIVSQDKMEITESSELKIDYITRGDEGFPICNIEIIGYYIMNKKDNTVLGKYSTEERAKEVLEEIIKQKAIFEFFKNVPERTQISLAKGFKEDNRIFDTYEMPKE